MSIDARARRLCFATVSALAVCAMAASSCRPSGSNATAADAPAAATPRVRGLDLAAIDRSVHPGDDFYKFANGTWLATTEIPPDRSTWGPTENMSEVAAERTRALLEAAGTASPRPGHGAAAGGRLLRELHGRRGHRGQGPRAAPADARPHRRHRLACRVVARPRRGAARRRGRAEQHQLPDRSAVRCVGHGGAGRSARRAGPICCRAASTCPIASTTWRTRRAWPAFARSLPRTWRARCGWRAWPMPTPRRPRSSRSKPGWRACTPAGPSRSTCSKPTTRGSARSSRGERPGIDWGAFLAGARLDTAPVIIVWHPSAVRGLSALVRSEPLASWKHWLTFHTIDRNAAVLPKAFVDERFAFHGKVLNGTPQLAERWKRGIAATSAAIPEAVGQIYVARYFPPETKAQMQAMVKNLITAFGARIDRLEWMSAATKVKAQAEAGDAARRRGVSGHVGRLPRPADRPRRRLRQPAARRALRVRAAPRQAGQAGGQGRVVDVTADRQCAESPAAERPELPGRHPRPAVLRPGGAGGHQLRRHRRRDRPRDHAQFRRHRRDVRRRGPPGELVDHGGPAAVPRRGRAAGGAVRRLRAVSRPAPQRPADAQREHRRRRRPCHRARRLAGVAWRHGRARARRLHRSRSSSFSPTPRAG